MPNIDGGIGHRPWTLCGAVAKIPYNNGFVTSVCTRFKDHTERAKKDPLKHFDERTRRSWYDEPTEPCIAPPE